MLMCRRALSHGSIKKICFSCVLILVVSLAVCWFLFGYTGDLVFLKNEKVIGGSVRRGNAALIDEAGNCYIRTTGDPLGLTGKLAKQYKRRFNVLKENTFVRIYDREDAQSVTLFDGGGTIVSTTGVCYLFTNGYDTYAIPTAFCTHVKKAVGRRERLYVLTDGNAFGWYSIADNSSFSLLLDDVEDFSLFTFTDAIMVLRKNGDLLLYSSEKNGDAITLMVNVRQFSWDDEWINGGYVLLFGGIYNDGSPFLYEAYAADQNAIVDTVKTALPRRLDVLSDAVSVYGRGFLVRAKDGRVLYYGRELFQSDPEHDGTIICDDAHAVASDKSSACIIRNDGSYLYGGRGPCDIVRLIKRQRQSGDGSLIDLG